MRSLLRSAVILCSAALGFSCGGDDGKSAPAPKPVGAAPASSSAPPTSFTPLKPDTTYVTAKFRPRISITLGDGEWTTETGDSEEHFSVSRHDVAELDNPILAVHRVTKVFDPREGGVIPGDEVPFEGDFAAWLAEHPHLRATKPKQVEMAGLKGVQLDIVSKSVPRRAPDDCGKLADPCVALFHDGLDDVMYGGDSKGRWTVLELEDGGQLVIEQYVEPRKEFAAGLDALAPTLESLELAG